MDELERLIGKYGVEVIRRARAGEYEEDDSNLYSMACPCGEKFWGRDSLLNFRIHFAEAHQEQVRALAMIDYDCGRRDGYKAGREDTLNTEMYHLIKALEFYADSANWNSAGWRNSGYFNIGDSITPGDLERNAPGTNRELLGGRRAREALAQIKREREYNE